MSAWAHEVAEAREDVLREYDPVTRDLLATVPVLARENSPGHLMWSAYFPRRHEVEVYSFAFDAMPDPENRRVQLRDCLRHEYAHALGEHFDEYAPHREAEVPDGWLGFGPMTIENDDITVTIPAVLP